MQYHVLHIAVPFDCMLKLKKKLNSVSLVRERTAPTDRRRLLAKLVPTFADKECRVVSATDTHGR
jgi:hypothetical protein